MQKESVSAAPDPSFFAASREIIHREILFRPCKCLSGTVRTAQRLGTHRLLNRKATILRWKEFHWRRIEQDKREHFDAYSKFQQRQDPN